MIKLENIAYPSQYLDCYEAVLITILKHMGLTEETPLMGTQAYFVLGEASVCPRFNRIDEEWERIHSLKVHILPVADKHDLRAKIIAKLDDSMPLCLPVDIYSLPHTPHYKHLHQVHYVDVFGYDDSRYYLVCPYYHYMGWVDSSLIHDALFSPVISDNCLRFIPELKLETLSHERGYRLVEESCQYMLGLTVPEALTWVDSKYLGLAGIRTLSEFLHELVLTQNQELPRDIFLSLSNQLKSIRDSRHWFGKFAMTYLATLVSSELAGNLQRQFELAVQTWEKVSKRLGAGTHARNPAMIGQAVLGLDQVYECERQLFNGLLGMLPGYETGKI